MTINENTTCLLIALLYYNNDISYYQLPFLIISLYKSDLFSILMFICVLLLFFYLYIFLNFHASYSIAHHTFIQEQLIVFLSLTRTSLVYRQKCCKRVGCSGWRWYIINVPSTIKLHFHRWYFYLHFVSYHKINFCLLFSISCFDKMCPQGLDFYGTCK